ncbi:MAG: ATP-dependent helicase [Woeseiaceae bacterium]
MSEIILTKQQKTAIEFEESMVVTACPGSGKTTVVVEKIRNIVQKIESYEGIIAITFTVKASQELKKRCRINGFDTRQSVFGTIDSFCLKEIIYPFIGQLWGGSPTSCTVLKKLTDDQRKNISQDYISPNLQDIYTDLVEFRTLYQNNILWMGSFSAIALYVLRESHAARRYMKSKFTHVFIDEYQDTSEVQHELFLELVEMGLIGTAVGDADQSIYAFRGSDPKYLNNLKLKSKIFTSFVIDINHRSHSSIVNYASRLLDSECELLEYDTNDIRMARRFLVGNASNAAAVVSTWIEGWVRDGKVASASEIGVLAKKEDTLKIVSEGLSIRHRLNVDSPLNSFGTPSADLYSSLLEYKYLSITTAQELMDTILSHNRYLYLKRVDLKELKNSITSLRTLNEPLKVISLCCLIATNLGFGIVADEVSALDEILFDDMLLSLFMKKHTDEVQLMTLHKSKGLEFKIVIHFDLEEWSFPYRQYTGDWNDEPSYPDISQETNLHYVGITRAVDLCILIRTELRKNSQGSFKRSDPSYFLCLPQLEGLYN